MTVETSLASLLEKLKVEDPWLPPQTWESIPSQSGRPPPPPPPPRASSSSSAVSERSLVRLSLNALQGLESALTSIEKLSSAFCSEPADRTFHKIPSLWTRSSSTDALGRILRSIGCTGSLVLLLHKFVDHFINLTWNGNTIAKRRESEEVEGHQNLSDNKVHKESCTSYSLVNQAFAIAVRKVLEGYTCALDTLCASVGFRRSSNSVDRHMHEYYGLGCLSNVVHSELTLLEVYLHTRELRMQIEALGNICNLHDIALSFLDTSLEDITAKATLECHKFYRGGDLLTYLYSQLKVADPAHLALLKFLFLRSCEPYCGFIRSWIFKAQINDPYEEFIVECVSDLPSYSWSRPGMSPLPRVMEQEGVAVPCFLKGFRVPLLRAGQQLQVLMKLLELCNYSASENYSYADLLPCWTCYSGNGPLHVSSMTFSKMHIEAMVSARDIYYKRMREKLGDVSRKLKLCYEKVSGYTVPVLYGDRGSLHGSVSVMPDDSLLSPSAAETDPAMAQNDLNYDDQDSEDVCSPEMDAFESSECSSTGDIEVNIETGQLELHNRLSGPKQNYLSALSFSVIPNPTDKPYQKQLLLDKSCHVGKNCNSASITLDVDDQSVDPALKGSNTLLMDVSYATEKRSVKSWPLGGLLRNPFGVDGESMDEVKPCLSDSIPNVNSSSVSKFSSLDEMKIGYPCNVLSMNPMLMRSAFFTPKSKQEDRNAKGNAKSLPLFDFSSVDDPCKVCLEKFSVVSTYDDSFEESGSSATAGKSGSHAKQQLSGDKTMGEDSICSYRHNPLGFKYQNQENASNTAGGSGWESLLSRSNNLYTGTNDDDSENLIGGFELPLEFVIDKCLLQEILLQYNFVSKLTIALLQEGFGLREHLLALRRYHFMELADWADLFIMSLWHHKWYVAEADQRIAELQGLLELSIQRSSCEGDSFKHRLFVYLKRQGTAPLSSSAIGVHSFDFLGLGYRVDWPVTIILTCDALKIYADIFSFLIQVKLAVFSLTYVWCSLKGLIHLIGQNRHELPEQEMRQLNILMKFRHQVHHFVSTLQQYVQSELSHVSWSKFLHSLKHEVKDMMDLESVHMVYLTESLHICFLSDETRSISSIIENILQCALDFRSCLPSGRWDRSQNQGDLLTNTSGVDTSKVMAIKQKFDKHMKELHLCYLRSPKHRQYGLSRLWGHLNFNEYYSEIFNETGNYPFVV